MKLIFVTNTFYPDANGVATYLTIITEALVKKGHHVAVFTHSHVKKPFESNRLKIIKVPSIKILKQKDLFLCVPNPFTFKKDILSLKPDIIQIGSVCPSEVAANIIGRKSGIPVVANFHGLLDMYEEYASITKLLKLNKLLSKHQLDFIKSHMQGINIRILLRYSHAYKNLRKKIIWKLMKEVYSKADMVVVPSLRTHKIVLSHGIPSKTIENGLDFKLFRKKKSYARTNKILYFGRLSYEKKIEMLLNAFAKIAKKYPDTSLTLMGNGVAKSSLKLLTKQLNIANQVTFLKGVDRSKLQSYFEVHDFFVNPSDSETFGYVTLEAMAAGLPVVGINVQGTGDLVKHNVNGFLTKPNDVNGFAKAIEKMLTTDLKKMGQASHKLAQKYSVEKSVREHIKLYKSLIRKH